MKLKSYCLNGRNVLDQLDHALQAHDHTLEIIFTGNTTKQQYFLELQLYGMNELQSSMFLSNYNLQEFNMNRLKPSFQILFPSHIPVHPCKRCLNIDLTLHIRKWSHIPKRVWSIFMRWLGRIGKNSVMNTGEEDVNLMWRHVR